MKRKKLLLCLLLLMSIEIQQLKAQKAVLSAGGNASGSSGSVSYSVGQVVYNTYASSNGSVAEGVQQPYEISTGIEETTGVSLCCAVYPNPTTGLLYLRLDNSVSWNWKQLCFTLYDVNGKLLESKSIYTNEQTIDMNKYCSASYFLKVEKDNKTLQSFKILKN